MDHSSSYASKKKSPVAKKKSTPQFLPFVVLAVLVVGVALVVAFFQFHSFDNTNTAQSDHVVTFVGQAAGVQSDYDDQILQEFTKRTGIRVNHIPRPESVNDAVQGFQAQFAAQSSDVDVYQIDVIWPGIFADDMVDLKPYFSDQLSQFFPAIVQNNTVDGKLVGIPYYTDVGLLYYRTDLLQKYGFDHPPKTWDELTAMAKKIQDGERKTRPHFWGYVWQGFQSESLTCNALEWQASMGGGSIIESNKTISVNNPNAVKAFDMVHKWVGYISPPEVTNFQEEDSRHLWQSGDAAFMRNWPYAYALGQASDSPIKGKFAITLLPSGGSIPEARNADTLGGWQLAVNKYSKHQADAIELVKFLTSAEMQKKRSIEKGYLPTISTLYSDPDVLSANPYYKQLGSVLAGGAIARPSSPTKKEYTAVSDAYSATVHDIILGKQNSADGLKNLEKKLVEITGFPIKAK